MQCKQQIKTKCKSFLLRRSNFSEILSDGLFAISKLKRKETPPISFVKQNYYPENWLRQHWTYADQNAMA